MNALTVAPNGSPGLIRGQTHDTDPNGGLHSGSLNDAPVRSGGYMEGQLGGQEAQRLKQQFQDEHANLPADQQKTWQDKADAQNAANHVGDDPDEVGQASSAPQPSAPQPSAFPVSTTPDPSVARAMADSASITGDQTGGQGYGKIGQVASPGDSTVTDAAGNRTISTAGGGTVSIPASQPQTPPDDSFPASNGTETGITSGGVPQVKQADGSFAAAKTDIPLTAGQPSATNPLMPASNPAAPDKLTASLGSPSLDTGKVASNGYFPGAAGAKSPGFGAGLSDDEDDEEGSARAFPGTMPNAFARR
jgi:hypothetical protein